jgi:arylformamidase
LAKSDWIDISLPIYAGMIGGPTAPRVKIELARDPEKGDPVTMAQITMVSHTGTHIDSPRHFFVNGTTIDELPLDTFIGPARIIEIKDTESIKPAELEAYDIQPGERLLFKTKNSSWVYDRDEFTTPYVYISNDAASYLAKKKVRLVGIDYITVGGWVSREDNRFVHKLFLDGGVTIMEEVYLKGVKPGRYELIALPLRIRKGDASPCRAIIRPL